MDKLNRIQAKLLGRTDITNNIPAFDSLRNHQDFMNISSPDQIPYLFEGDIILTEDQLQDIINYNEFELYKKENKCHTPLQKRKKRTLTSSTSLRWRSFPIPYMITSGVDRTAIANGLKNWVDTTCITFQEVSGSSGNMLQFIYGPGCYSNIGMIGGVQQISIGNGCNIPGIVSHEVGHSLGYYHEHARFDRDNYVQILSQNIPSQYLSQFTKVSPSSMTTFGVEYDLGSVMHYDPYSFTSNGQPTIDTADPNYQDTIGQRVGLSFNDIKKINFAYCNRTCSSNLNCQNAGYTDPKNCNICRCPTGLGGTYCEQALPTSYNCGNVNLHAGSSLLTLSQSGYGICNYLITAPPGRRILINVQSISFYQSTPCDNTYLEVKYKKDLGNTGPRFCDTVPNTSIFSETETAVLIYVGAASNHRFTITYRYDPPTSGTITDSPITQPPTQWTTTTQSWTQPLQTTTQPNSNLPWTTCSASCGGCGIQVQFRNGQIAQVRYCNTTPCPGGWFQSNFCCQPFYYYAQTNSCYRYQDETKVTVPPNDWPFALGNRTENDSVSEKNQASALYKKKLAELYQEWVLQEIKRNSTKPETSTKPVLTTTNIITRRAIKYHKNPKDDKKRRRFQAAGEVIRITSRPVMIMDDLIAIDRVYDEGSGENE
uniref:Metalloendopeptidase n=1 Tax=Acrobeloides nanus TaxID=290746 RepID=A0A914DEJ0_9BILA